MPAVEWNYYPPIEDILISAASTGNAETVERIRAANPRFANIALGDLGLAVDGATRHGHAAIASTLRRAYWGRICCPSIELTPLSKAVGAAALAAIAATLCSYTAIS